MSKLASLPDTLYFVVCYNKDNNAIKVNDYKNIVAAKRAFTRTANEITRFPFNIFNQKVYKLQIVISSVYHAQFKELDIEKPRIN